MTVILSSMILTSIIRISLFTLGSPVRYEILDLSILALNFIPALGRFFWVTCRSNQPHGRRWWKAWMGLDFHHRTFGIFWNFLQSLNDSHIGRTAFGSGGPYQFLPCAFHTTRFPVFNRIPERVGPPNFTHHLDCDIKTVSSLASS